MTSWRHPAAQADAGVNIAHWAEMARLVERGKFDLIFFADSLVSREGDIDAISSFGPIISRTSSR